jgi:hypothetical protein
MLSKRRTAVSVAQLPALFDAGDAQQQWFADRVQLRGLAPVCQVSYRRRALVGTGPYGPMRLTFDDDVRAQDNLTTLFSPDLGTPVHTGHVIIEMKFCIETPVVMKHLVETFQLSPAPVSKYRLAQDALQTPLGQNVIIPLV